MKVRTMIAINKIIKRINSQYMVVRGKGS